MGLTPLIIESLIGLLAFTILASIIFVPLGWTIYHLSRAVLDRTTSNPDATPHVSARRIGALLIDTFPATLLGTIIVMLGTLIAPRVFYSYRYPSGTTPTLTTFLTGFAGYYLYFLALEPMWDGRTIGKQVLSLRATTTARTPATPRALAIRNLVRPIDSFVNYSLAIFSIIVSDTNQRIGDRVAGTCVSHTSQIHDATDTTPDTATDHPATSTPRQDTDSDHSSPHR